ncbi:hypothetical protein RhiirB3_381098 [Rhizophagus irregularis]|nr:hypothetical protein RhiirB3_381098 [Rhizophagus irregularis]
MDVDKPLTPPGPVETTSTEIPSQPDISSLDTSQHAPANNNDKGKSPAITSAVSFPERAVSLDVSQAAVQSQPTLFYASAAPNDVEGFWTHFASNRDACDVVDRQLSLFSSYGSRATCSGSNDLKRIIVHFRKKNDLDTATASPMDSLFGLHFHAYDPQAIKAAEHMRTLVVTDIPLLLLTRFCVVPFLVTAILLAAIPVYLNFIALHTLPLNLLVHYRTLTLPGASFVVDIAYASAPLLSHLTNALKDALMLLCLPVFRVVLLRLILLKLPTKFLLNLLMFPSL